MITGDESIRVNNFKDMDLKLKERKDIYNVKKPMNVDIYFYWLYYL